MILKPTYNGKPKYHSTVDFFLDSLGLYFFFFLFIAVCRLLTAVASLVEHGL